MNAIWGTDYDLNEDKCYKLPCCPKCEAPIGRYQDDEYRCFSCGRAIKVVDKDMKEWFKKREQTKVEMENCPKIISKSGHVLGCGGHFCVETHYIRNPITLRWQVAFGRCTKCGRRFVV